MGKSRKKEAAAAGPQSDSKNFKKISDAQKHVESFFNSVSDDENFCLECFTSGEGIQVVASTSPKQ